MAGFKPAISILPRDISIFSSCLAADIQNADCGNGQHGKPESELSLIAGFGNIPGNRRRSVYEGIGAQIIIFAFIIRVRDAQGKGYARVWSCVT